MRERRSEPRSPVDQPVVVTVLDSGDGEPFEGTVVDLSRSGLGVHVPWPIDLGCRVEITWSRGTVIAEVRNCHWIRPNTYRVGLKTSEVVALAEIRGRIGAA
jgi:hypothetical protein